METVFLWIGFASAIAGLIATIVIWKFWQRVSRFYREHWPKTIVSFFRLLAAFVALFSKPVPLKPDTPILEQPWSTAAILAAVAYFLWECVGHWGDSKHKASKEKSSAAFEQEVQTLTQDRTEAENESKKLLWLITTLREITSNKLQRIRRTISESVGTNASLPQARMGLNPSEQIHIVLESLATFFRLETTTSPVGYNQNFRVGLFGDHNGYLVPIVAFDLLTKSHEPFSSHQRYADRYRLTNDVNPSQAVRCVVEGSMIIVPDCVATEGFEFFNDQQRSYLRSLLAYPLTDYCRHGTTPIQAVLIVDTNIPNFFLEEDREMLELLIREFAVRLNLEYAIHGLINRVTLEGG